MKRIIATTGFAAITLFIVFAPISPVISKARSNIELISSNSYEERKELAYGRLGYGYIKQILPHIPEKDFFPLIRYPDFHRDTQVLFDGLYKNVDDRILIGVRLKHQDMREKIIARAVSLRNNYWQANVTSDCDTLTGLNIVSEKPQTLKLKLYDSPKNMRLLGQWQFELKKNDNFLTTTPPVNSFAILHNNTPFLIEAQSESPLESMALIGIKINLSGYTVVNKNGGNFTALKTDFLEQITSENSGWTNFLSKVKNVY